MCDSNTDLKTITENSIKNQTEIDSNNSGEFTNVSLLDGSIVKDNTENINIGEKPDQHNNKQPVTETFSSTSDFSEYPTLREQALEEEKNILLLELTNLKRISDGNSRRITRLRVKHNRLNLIVNLLDEERQKLENSQRICQMNETILNDTVKHKYEHENATNEEKKHAVKLREIITKLFNLLNKLEATKINEEYENIRLLYDIKELQEDNLRLRSEIKRKTKHKSNKSSVIFGSTEQILCKEKL